MLADEEKSPAINANVRLPPGNPPGIQNHIVRPILAAVPGYWRAKKKRTMGPMLAKLETFSLLGIDALPVEVDVSPSGLPKTVLVGLPEAAVKESTHRVERAIVNSGFQRPQNRVVINLAPACSRQ